jgi:hypothetical protein
MQQIPCRRASNPLPSQEISLCHILLNLTAHYIVSLGGDHRALRGEFMPMLAKYLAMKANASEGREWSTTRASHYTTVKLKLAYME